MARWFRVINVSVHCGLPIVIASIILCIISAACQAYSLYFLPKGAAIPLMIAAIASGLVGVLAALTGIRILTILYMISGSLIQIPVFVVIGFLSYTLTIYHNDCVLCRFPYTKNYPYPINTCTQTSYVKWLCGLDNGLLWSALAVAFIACCFIGNTMHSFRKLRLYQAGVRGDVVQERGHGHHHHHHDHFVVQPTQAVYTVPTTAVVTAPSVQPPVIYQQNPPVYPVVPPPAYNAAIVQPVGVVGTVQPVNYNPPRNPDF